MGILLRLAWCNLWRHKRRTWLTASAIAFITTLLIFIITLQLGAFDMMLDTGLRVFTGQMQIQRVGYLDKPQMRLTIPAAQAGAEKLRRSTGLAAIAVRTNGFALAASGTRSYGVPVIGVEPEREALVSTIPHLVKTGRYLASDTAQELVVGAVLARNLRIKLGDELTLLGAGKDGSVAATVLPVVGFFESGVPELDRHLVEMPLRTFQDVFGMGDDAHALVISGPGLEQMVATQALVRQHMPQDPSLVLLDWERLLPGIKQVMQADTIEHWFLYITLILVVTFSILNTFLMSVLERTREFGIMLALGATPLRIGGLVLLESALLTLIGLAMGLAIGGAIAVYYHYQGFTFQAMQELYQQFGLEGTIKPKITFVNLMLGPAVIFVFTFVAALYPALRIRKLHIVEAMHAVH